MHWQRSQPAMPTLSLCPGFRRAGGSAPGPKVALSLPFSVLLLVNDAPYESVFVGSISIPQIPENSRPIKNLFYLAFCCFYYFVSSFPFCYNRKRDADMQKNTSEVKRAMPQLTPRRCHTVTLQGTGLLKH